MCSSSHNPPVVVTAANSNSNSHHIRTPHPKLNTPQHIAHRDFFVFEFRQYQHTSSSLHISIKVLWLQIERPEPVVQLHLKAPKAGDVEVFVDSNHDALLPVQLRLGLEAAQCHALTQEN